MTHHLAQFNVARLLAPIDHPDTAAFVEALDPLNAVADAAPGFVWRLQTDSGNATDVQVGDDPYLIVNLSVWESIDALRDYVYGPEHLEYFRRRREWFSRLGKSHLVLWWVPAGHRPSVEEALERLEALRVNGPTPEAFTFIRPHPPPP